MRFALSFGAEVVRPERRRTDWRELRRGQVAQGGVRSLVVAGLPLPGHAIAFEGAIATLTTVAAQLLEGSLAAAFRVPMEQIARPLGPLNQKNRRLTD